jgi:hypothetical protein
VVPGDVLAVATEGSSARPSSSSGSSSGATAAVSADSRSNSGSAMEADPAAQFNFIDTSNVSDYT